MDLFALTLYSRDPVSQRLILHAMPVMIAVLCCLAIAYRYYSAFLAAKVAAFDDTRPTPAVRLNDGQNYHPTNRWVLFGHHFAAISGAGPLIGPVLAIQYGFAPGLVWLVIGVCLAGAVQDMLVMAASVRRDGKSIAEIARHELGYPAAVIASVAILFIVVIALAGLGLVVVKALGGEEVKLPKGTQITVPVAERVRAEPQGGATVLHFPPGCSVRYEAAGAATARSEPFAVRVPGTISGNWRVGKASADPTEVTETGSPHVSYTHPTDSLTFVTPAGCAQVVAGSSWGTFTIACTIPIALLVGLWMYRIRPGRVVEASLIGGVLTLAAVVIGEPVSRSALGAYFSLTREQTIAALGTYGFVAAVLPVWLLLGPRDYLSSFLKIGTIGLLVVSVCVANPALQAPALNEVFINGGPTFPGQIFPFVFICIMCGSISGFHALVSSGTTPKMVEKESHIRTIGYGSMLMEGLVAVTALIAAAALPSELYYAINVPIDRESEFKTRLDEVFDRYGVKVPPEAADPAHATNVSSPQHLDLGRVEEKVGGESLRGRTGGAVTLAVGMSVIFEQAFMWLGVQGESLLKYWYHFAIMFEALFILTTIDAGTRIARFLLQESVGRVYTPVARPDWLPGAVLASATVTLGWVGLVWTGSITTIWSMFGIANQLLAVLALALVTTWLVNNGRGRYALVTALPMLFVCSTTFTAGTQLVTGQFAGMISSGRAKVEQGQQQLAGATGAAHKAAEDLIAAGEKSIFTGYMNAGLTVFVITCVLALLLWSAARWVSVWLGPLRRPNADGTA
ncbi:carbon starvation protein A [Gemmata sp. JC673]|uniref:Carbon starvation protein A n=1 Tax=Gemmata algarum TaxID=2975278 RepID=A0ABU5F2Z6_9BACT|nr:carbon starvation CstA family protein [Gemmata algarum]MDY3560291.1 carbon starvation protein A [Gemmata algarum]